MRQKGSLRSFLLFFGISTKTEPMVLPVGNPSLNFTNDIRILIFDSIQDYAFFEFEVRVRRYFLLFSTYHHHYYHHYYHQHHSHNRHNHEITLEMCNHRHYHHSNNHPVNAVLLAISYIPLLSVSYMTTEYII